MLTSRALDNGTTPAMTQDLAGVASGETITSPPPSSRSWCLTIWNYGENGDVLYEARGYALLAMARGVAVMGNVVVSAALVQLASEAAGCQAGADACTGTVYGLRPVSLISGIPLVSGLLSSMLMPIIGTIIDFTSYRKFVGILFSVIFAVIQAIQIAIGERTWFAMAILQAVAGFCYIVNILTTLAYLPEICEQVGEKTHAEYTSRFTVKQFSMQTSFLILVSVLSYGLGISGDSVQTARLSQALNFSFICILYGVGWRWMPSRHATQELPHGMRGLSILAYGVRLNIRTSMSILRKYRKGLRCYLLATMFVQPGVASLTSISVVYLSAEVGLNATDTLIFFLVVLVGTIPGAILTSFISKRTNPNTSWQFSMLFLFVIMVIGAVTLGDARNKYMSMIWGFFIGIMLGWFYPTENLFFSCILPKGKEAEIAGFRVYFSAILGWLPPLIFGIAVEKGIDPKWGLTMMGSFIFVAALLLKCCSGSWGEIIEESGRSGLNERINVSEREAPVESPITTPIQHEK